MMESALHSRKPPVAGASPAELKIAAVVPAYNHPETVDRVVREVGQKIATVIVVDDGSRPPVRIASRAAADLHLVRHPRNLGKGAAILSAAARAGELGVTHIITIDADGQHFPRDLPAFIAAIKTDPEALIVGLRDFDQAHVPPGSRFGRSFSNFWFRVQTGHRIGDSQSGFRAYPLRLLHSFSWREKRYAFENEILVRAVWAGIRIREIGIAVHYPEKDRHISHFHRFWDNFRLSLLNTRLTIRSMLPWPHELYNGHHPDSGPPVSLLHPVRTLKLLLGEHASPARLALAVALGTLVGCLPLIGCRAFLILVASNFFRLNKIVALAAGNIGFPPFVPALCIELGYLLRHGSLLTEISLQTLGYQAPQRIWEWILGSLLVAPALAVLCGLLTYAMALVISRRQAVCRERRAE